MLLTTAHISFCNIGFMIIIDSLTGGYTQSPILHDIDWHIKRNEHWVVTGPMGAGKTALLHAITGRLRKHSGKINYQFLDNPDSYEERREAIHLVSFTDPGKLFNSVNAVHYYQQRYQAFDSDGHLTVKAYLQDGGLDLEKDNHRQFLDLMNLWHLLDMERIKLSSGQIRKVLLCKAFLGQPKFLLLDNPHIGLDTESRSYFNRYLDQLVGHFKQQIILSGHFRSLPSCINRHLELEDGRIYKKGKPSAAKAVIQKPALKPSAELISIFKKPSPTEFETLLKFDQLEIHYKNNEIIQQLDWTVIKGDKWVVQGPNGSGKSTLISLIYGDHPQAYSNKIILFDRQRGTGESIWEIKNKIGFTSPELHSYFNYNHPAEDMVLTGLSDTFFVQTRPPDKVRLCHMLFNYFGIDQFRNVQFQKLSTGMQRLLFFIRALIKMPPVLLLDEPYQGLDNETVNKCNQLLNHILTADHTLIFISHFADEVPKLADKILKI